MIGYDKVVVVYLTKMTYITLSLNIWLKIMEVLG